jgi:hypothetical protein
VEGHSCLPPSVHIRVRIHSYGRGAKVARREPRTVQQRSIYPAIGTDLIFTRQFGRFYICCAISPQDEQ